MFNWRIALIGAFLTIIAIGALCVFVATTFGDSIWLGLIACVGIFSPLWWAANIDPFD